MFVTKDGAIVVDGKRVNVQEAVCRIEECTAPSDDYLFTQAAELADLLKRTARTL